MMIETQKANSYLKFFYVSKVANVRLYDIHQQTI